MSVQVTGCTSRAPNGCASGETVIRPLTAYLVGTGSWFAAFGLQSVLFTWLVTMVLLEPARNVGLAQMALLLPTATLILLGGSIADRVSSRRLCIAAHVLGTLPVCWLWYVLATDSLAFNKLLLFAVAMGTVQAFVTPARDGLLNQVAGSDVQRTVVLTSMVQFGLQMLGLGLSMLADRFGPELLLATQVVVLLIGAVAYWRIPPDVESLQSVDGRPSIMQSLSEGARTVLRSAHMRSIVVLNIALGILFMGSYMVATPVLIRAYYSTDSSALAGVNMMNSLGLFVMIVVLLRLGSLQRPGRALLWALTSGGFVLAACALPIPFAGFLGVIFVWGLCGGVAMSMSRTVMQELAPAGQRGRVMSFYSFSMMGAGLFGAYWAGLLCTWFDPRIALLVNGVLMVSVASAVYLFAGLAQLRSPGAVTN